MDALRRVSDHELILTAALAPFLLFSSLNKALTALAAAGIAVLWLARWIGRGVVTRRTPLDGLVLVVMIMTLVAMWASPLPAQSADAACRVLLGIALYFALANTVDTLRAFRRILTAALLGGAIIALVGLFTTRWNEFKIPALAPVYAYLPDLSGLLGVLAAEQDSTPGAFHPNFIGATLAVLTPLAAGLIATASRRVERLALASGALLMIGVLIITQSRLGLASLIVALMVAGLRRFPRLRLPVIASIVVAASAALAVGPERILASLTPVVAAQGFGTWQARVVLWEGALRVLGDFPFTGIGLSTFYPAAMYLYAFDLPAGWIFGHAHETYLQMGVDFGLAGLLSFLAILGIAIWQGWPDAHNGGVQPLRISVWTSLLVYALFGLFDGLPMWTKPGFIVWVLLASVMIGRRLAAQTSDI